MLHKYIMSGGEVMNTPCCKLGYQPIHETPPCENPHFDCPFLGDCPLRTATEIFIGFSSYDVMESFMDADIEIPRGERFYDPIYEEAWD